MVTPFLLSVLRCFRDILSARRYMVQCASQKMMQPIAIPFWASLLIRVGLFYVRTVQAYVRVPSHDILLEASRYRIYPLSPFPPAFPIDVQSLRKGECYFLYYKEGGEFRSSSDKKLCRNSLFLPSHPLTFGSVSAKRIAPSDRNQTRADAG
jgi:hypothetical protein